MNIDDVRGLIEKHGIDTIKVGGLDIDGIFRGKRVPAKEFLHSTWKNGLNFCDVLFGWDIQNRIYENPVPKFSGWHTGFPDLAAVPVLDTFRVVPGEQGTASVICDYYKVNSHGERTELEISPRSVLKNVLKKAQDMGYYVFSATELEFYLFDETLQAMAEKKFANPKFLNPGISCYNIFRETLVEPLFGEMRRRLDQYGIEIEACNTEYGPGQFEMNLKYSECLEQADRTVLFKNFIKEIAAEKNLFATFMAKWKEVIAGNGLHIHQSLWDLDAKNNLFYDNKNPHNMSDIMRYYIGGVLETMHEFMPFYAQTVNAYKRYEGDSYAPTNATWAHDNRTTAARAISETPTAARVEWRVPAACSNIYLVKAAVLAAGLYGIENKIEPPKDLGHGNAYLLPQTIASSLAKSLPALEKGSVAKQYMGEALVDHFLDTRKWEVYLYEKAVTDWERERYMEHV